MGYRGGSYTVCQIECHFVWVTKYRCMVVFEMRIFKGLLNGEHIHIPNGV